MNTWNLKIASSLRFRISGTMSRLFARYESAKHPIMDQGMKPTYTITYINKLVNASSFTFANAIEGKTQDNFSINEKKVVEIKLIRVGLWVLIESEGVLT